jgi:hypothetical protein
VDGRHDHKTSGAATASSHDETTSTKKSTAAPPQQLPSPLASEDETPVRKVAPLKRSSSKNKGHHPASDSDGAVPYRDLPEKPFNPKKPEKKAAGQILQRALKTRAKHGTLTTSGFRSRFSTQVATPGRGQIPKLMGTSLSKTKKEPPSKRRTDGRIQKRKPAQRKGGLDKAVRSLVVGLLGLLAHNAWQIDLAKRAIAPGSPERDIRLRALLQQISNENERGFRRLDEAEKRAQKIKEEVERMKRAVRPFIWPLKTTIGTDKYYRKSEKLSRPWKENMQSYIRRPSAKFNATLNGIT